MDDYDLTTWLLCNHPLHHSKISYRLITNFVPSAILVSILSNKGVLL